MKTVILFLFGVLFSFLGYSGIGDVYVSLPALIAATMVLAEILNNWRDWHEWRASLCAAAVGTALALVGYGFNWGFLAGMGVEQLLIAIIQIVLYAFGIWSGVVKNIIK